MASQSRPLRLRGSRDRKEPEQAAQANETSQFEWVAEDQNLINKASPSQSSLNLHFVAESGTARPRGTYRNLIRSHARRSLATQTYSGKGLVDEHKERGLTGKLVRTQNIQPKAQRKPKHPAIYAIRGPVNGLRDPFDALPIGSNSHIQGLLNHWDKVFRHSYAPPSPREKWLPFALLDAAALNATLFVSALNICGLKGVPLSPDVFYFKGETIRVINEGFGDSKKRASDGMIAAVASLAHLENLAGTPDGAKMHMDGLEAMVKSRGGVDALGSHGIPRTQALWTDTCAAIVLGTKPRFKHNISDDEENPADWKPYSSIALRYKTKLFNLTGSYSLSQETVGVYWGLRNLSAFKDEGSRLPVAKADVLPYSNILAGIERRLITIIQAEELVTPVQDLSIYPLFANAAILHIYIFLRDLSKGLPFSHLMALRIRTMLENVDVSRLKEQYPEMLLWILMIGGLCGADASERIWFAAMVAEFCLELGVHGGNEIAAMLSEFLWTELYRSPMTMGFWNDVAKAQGFEGGYAVRKLSDFASVAIFNAPPNTG